jgi:hypothetical protein
VQAPGFALASVLALLGCQRTKTVKSQPAAAPTTPVAFTPKRGEPVDVHGIVVTFRDDGMVAIRGRDRFGTPLDTVYENVEFLRNALPVLERSLTVDQSVGLRELLPQK